jgi:hypothetical protein
MAARFPPVPTVEGEFTAVYTGRCDLTRHANALGQRHPALDVLLGVGKLTGIQRDVERDMQPLYQQVDIPDALRLRHQLERQSDPRHTAKLFVSPHPQGQHAQQ